MLPLDAHWAKYASEHAAHYNFEMAKFVSDLVAALRCQSVLEVGCSAGNELKLLPDSINVCGIDASEAAVSSASRNLPGIEFKAGLATSIPYSDAAFDFVFTRNVLNYVRDSDVQKAVDEMFRVSRKYIVNIEAFSEEESVIFHDQIEAKGRNMKNRWMNYSVKIISNVDMHEEIDPFKSRFTLVRKV